MFDSRCTIGEAIRSTLDAAQTQQYSLLMSMLTAKARVVVRDLQPSNDLSFFRMRGGDCEILVSPQADFLLIVIQK